MEKSESIAEIAKAMSKAWLELGHAKKDSTNPHFKSKYSDISEVIDTIKPVFCKHGLSFIQMPSMEGNLLTLTTMLLHVSGEYISEVAKTPVSKQDPQGILAAITYLRRGSMTAFAGLSQEDDDGNTASSGKADHDYSHARAKSPPPAPTKPYTAKVPAVAPKRTEETPPPMTDAEAASIAFSLEDDDDTPEWMRTNNITLDDTPPPPRQSSGTYHYKFPAPYKQKERAKELKCRWNKERFTWDSDREIEEFSKWLEGVTE